MDMPYIRVDMQAQMGYAYLTDGHQTVARTDEFNHVLYDIDTDNQLIGMEFFRIEVNGPELTHDLATKAVAAVNTAYTDDDIDTMMAALSVVWNTIFSPVKDQA